MKPLKFKALLKQTIWGGDKIIPFKHLNEKLDNVGESWEISGVPGNETVVADGEFAGEKLNVLVAKPTMSASETSFHCSSSSLTPAKTSLSRYILPMRLPRSKARSGERPRCGTSWTLTRGPSSIAD